MTFLFRLSALALLVSLPSALLAQSAGSSTVGGGRIYKGGVVDMSLASSLIPPVVSVAPSGVCTGRGARVYTAPYGSVLGAVECVYAASGDSAGTWTAVATGGGFAYGSPYYVSRTNPLYTGAEINDPHQTLQPTTDYFVSDGRAGQSSAGTVQTGGVLGGEVFNTVNWQTIGKHTVLLRQIVGHFGSGQTNLFQMTLNKYGKGDGALIDGVVNCKGQGNTAGDEDCTAFRAELNGSLTNYGNAVGPRGYSTCSATLADEVAYQNNTASGTRANYDGVLPQTVHLSSMSNCNVGDYVMFDAPPSLTEENELTTQDGHDSESLKLYAVNSGAGTVTAYFRGVHHVGSLVKGESYMTKNTDPVLGNTEYDHLVHAKSLVVNGNTAKWYRTGTVSQVANNGAVFALDAGSGGVWSASMMGGTTAYNGMCVAMDQDEAWKPDGRNDSWLQIKSITSTQFTLVNIQHYNKINHSAYKFAPCTSVEAIDLDTSKTPAQVGKVVLFPQSWGTVGGVNYDFVAGDTFISATGSSGQISFANVIGRTAAPFQKMGGLIFKPQGVAQFDNPIYFQNGDSLGLTTRTELGNFTAAFTITIPYVFNPHKAAAYFYNGPNQSGGLLAVQPTCYPGNGGDATKPASQSLTCTFASATSGSYAVYHAIGQYNTLINIQGNYYKAAMVFGGLGMPDVQTSPNVEAPPAIQFFPKAHFDHEPGQQIAGTQATIGFDGKALEWFKEDGTRYRLEVDYQGNLRLKTMSVFTDIFHWTSDGRTVIAAQQLVAAASEPHSCTVAADVGLTWVQVVDSNNSVFRVCLKTSGTVAWVTK